MSGDRTMLRAKFAYAAKHDDELSFDAGVEIALLEKKENGWWRGELIGSGAVGLFPYNYVEVLPSTGSPMLSPRANQDDTAKEKRRRSDSNAKAPSVQEQQDGKERVIALEDYSSKDKQQLDFKKDDVIIVIQKFPTGWWKGELQGRVGVFPQKTVKPFGDGKGEEKSSKKQSKNRSKGSRDNTARKRTSSSSRGNKGDHAKSAGEDTLSQVSTESDNDGSGEGDEHTESANNAGGVPSIPSLSLSTTKTNDKDKNAHYVRALEPYQASGPGQLSFNKGDMIKVIEKKDDWWLGELNRAIGLFPVDTCEDLNPSAPASAAGGASNAKVAVALFDFKGSGEGQLSFSKEDKINILAKLESGWWRGEINGKIGHFPGSYVREESADSSSASVAAAVASPRASVNLSDTVARQPTMKNLGAKIRAVAVHKYVAKDDNQLSFEPNEEIMVIAKAANGWWSGELRGKIGHFPGSYVREVDGTSSDSSAPASAASASAAAKPAPRSAEMRRATAIYNYSAQSSSELSIKVGDELVLLPSTAADTKGWLTGYLVSNKTQVGHFPAGYVKIQEKDGSSTESGKTEPGAISRAKTVSGIRQGSAENSDSDSGKSESHAPPPSKPVPPVPSRASVQLSSPPVPELTTPPILTTPSAPNHTPAPSKDLPPLPPKSTPSSSETPAAAPSGVPTGLARAQTTSIAPVHRDRKPSTVVPPRASSSETSTPARASTPPPVVVAATVDPAVVEKAAQAATAKELEKFKTAMVKLQQQTKVAVDEMLSRIDAQQKERLKLEYVMRDMKRTLKEEKDARLRVEQQNKVLYQELTALKQKQAQTEQDSKISDEFSGMSATEMRNQIRRLTSQLDQEVHARQDLQSFVSQLQSDIDAIKRAVGSGGSVAGRAQMHGSGHLNNTSNHSSSSSHSGGGRHHEHHDPHHVDPDDYFYRPN